MLQNVLISNFANEDANWNNKQQQTKGGYLEGKPVIEYINLYPGKYRTIGNQGKQVNKISIMYTTGDASYFWQKPQ